MRDLFYGISEQGKAGKHRWEDASILLREQRWRGAMYLAGYSIECLLKTKLMKIYGCRHLRELDDELKNRGILPVDATVFTHHLQILLHSTGAQGRLQQNREYWQLFNLVNQWIPAWRYTANPSNSDDATDFLEAVAKLASWIENNI